MPYQSPDTKQPSMSEKEFKEAIDNILPLTNDKLRRRLFFESEKMMRKEGLTNSVPIMRLARILLLSLFLRKVQTCDVSISY